MVENARFVPKNKYKMRIFFAIITTNAITAIINWGMNMGKNFV